MERTQTSAATTTTVAGRQSVMPGQGGSRFTKSGGQATAESQDSGRKDSGSQAAGSQKGVIKNKWKIGYGFGIWGDTMGNSLYYSFFQFFMTNIARVAPAIVGLIAMFGVIWDGITDPIVAFIAAKMPIRKKNLLMMLGSIPYAAALVMCFSAPPLEGALKSAYYIAVAMLMFLGYTCYCIPFYSIVPQLTEEYDERTKMRSISSFLNTFANLFVLTTPMLIVGFLTVKMGSETSAWTGTASIYALVVIIAAFICFASVNKMITATKADQKKKVPLTGGIKSLFKSYGQLLKLKQVRIIIYATLCFMLNSTITRTSLVYFVKYVIKGDDQFLSICYMIRMLSWLPLIPLGTKIAQMFDRRIVLMSFFGITAVLNVILFFGFGVNTAPACIALLIISAFGNVAYYTFMFTMAYDLCLLDEYVNKVNREPICTALPLLFQKLASSVSMLIWGLLLQWTQFDPDLPVQTAQTQDAMCILIALGGAVFLALAVAFLSRYKISKKMYEKLEAVVQRRRNGEADADSPELAALV